MDRNEDELVEQKVTYALLKEGQLYVIEHVPARVNVETGEQFFAPQIVEHLQRLILGPTLPARVIETPVYEYA